MNSEDSSEFQQPVAYDADGRPLYHHPPASSSAAAQTPTVTKRRSHITAQPDAMEGQNYNPQIRVQYANNPDVVHATRDVELKKFGVSRDLADRHQASVERYPYLNLSEGEYVILDIRRHPIGMLTPIGITLALLFGIFVFSGFYPTMYDEGAQFFMPAPVALFGIALLISALVVLGGAVGLWVYLQNQFFMTNESVIQEVQESLFSRREQSVSLGSIEDASFRQEGIFQTLLDYGTIRLSIEGDQTTYNFRYARSPKRQIAVLSNAIEAFKNGRPVEIKD